MNPMGFITSSPMKSYEQPPVLLDAWQPRRSGHLGEDATHQRLAMSIRSSMSVGRGMQQLLANK